MTARSAPVGAYESRHITTLAKGDLVWDVELRRWREVTSVLHYTAERTKQDMVKIVLDISTYHRHVAGGDTHYAVLLDERPAERVRPLTATERRRNARRGARDDDSDATTTPPVAEQPTVTTSAPAERRTAVPDQVVPTVDVRARREALRLSRHALAERAGLTPGALWRVEDGRPKNDELDRVIATLDSEEAQRATH